MEQKGEFFKFRTLFSDPPLQKLKRSCSPISLKVNYYKPRYNALLNTLWTEISNYSCLDDSQKEHTIFSLN